MGHHRDYDHKRFNTHNVNENTTKTQIVGGTIKSTGNDKNSGANASYKSEAVLLAEIEKYFVGRTAHTDSSISPYAEDRGVNQFDIKYVRFEQGEIMMRGEDSVWFGLNRGNIIKIT